MQKELEANINSLKLKISIASKTVSKDADDISLIAVSKKKSLDHIKMAKDIGIDFLQLCEIILSSAKCEGI